MTFQGRPGALDLREPARSEAEMFWALEKQNELDRHLRSHLSLELAVTSGGTSVVLVPCDSLSPSGERFPFHSEHGMGLGLPITVS